MTASQTTAGSNSRMSRITKGKMLLMLKTSSVVMVFVIFRLVITYFGWDLIVFNSLVGSFVAGVFFTIGIILAGVVTDYKEAEKIPTELTVLLKALRYDTRFLTTQYQDKQVLNRILTRIEELLIAINNNFRSNQWHKKDLDKIIGELNDDIIEVGKSSVAPFLLTRLRDSLTNIDRLSNRIDTIAETNFIPAAYMVATVGTAAVLAVLALTPDVWQSGGWLVTVLIVFVMVSVFLLIRDIDNPFEYNKNTCADVDLSVLFRLETFWKENWEKD